MYDFNTLDLGEDLTTRNRQAEIDAVVAQANVTLRKQLNNQFGVKLINSAQAPRIAANPVSQQEYNCRLYALLNIIRNPELTEERYPLAHSWKTLYPAIAYNEKATNWKISKRDRETIKNLLKELKMYGRLAIESVKDVVGLVTDFRKTQVIQEQAAMLQEQDKQLKTYQMLVDDSDSIWYKGYEIKRLTRKYQVIAGGVELCVPLSGVDKLFNMLHTLDNVGVVEPTE